MTQYVFYDTETTGANPTFDQVLQAAAILTDEDFNEIDSIDIRSRLAGHIVPSAGALKVTGVNPYDIARAPYGSYEFARLFHDIFTKWSADGDTSFAGFNTIQFDEEIMRQMFWQSLQEPYLTSGKGKMRTDYLIMLRALHARNPDVIEFPVNPDTGKKSFKLELIAPANGFDGHDAHDALGDVRATIFIAKLIKEVDPHLYDHMLAMGNANFATQFIDDEVVFQLLGGQMVNPGILDVCLIASEQRNNKSKTAWNLAIDPTPYLDMSPEQILAAMRKPGTPFRTVKCNKQPGAFPMNWGFNHRVSTADFEPADQITIDERAELIQGHAEFRANTQKALALKVEGYDAPEHLEQKIYSGFPSWDDKDRMRTFHTSPDWEARLNVVRKIEKPELRAHGIRTVFLNAPEAMSPALREQIDQRLSEERFTLDVDRPWTTVGSLLQELDKMQEKDPDDPELANIRQWALETYPIASEWEAHKEARDAMSAEDREKPQEKAKEAAKAPKEASATATPTPVKPKVAPKPRQSISEVAVSYLDGLD